MELEQYQQKVRSYANYPLELGPYAIILNLQEDIGTLSGKLRSLIDTISMQGNLSKEDKQRIGITIGDILFDIANMATDMQLSLEEISLLNIRKHEIIQKRLEQKMENENIKLRQENNNLRKSK